MHFISLLPAKAIEKWGSLIVIGLGMLLGGLVFPIAIQAWKYKLPLTGGNLLAAFWFGLHWDTLCLHHFP